MTKHVAASKIPFMCTMEGCQFKCFTRMKAWTHCKVKHGADKTDGAVEHYCSGTYKNTNIGQLITRRLVDRRDSRTIFWRDSRGYQNDRTRYGRSYVPDRWVPSYRSQQKHFTSYSRGQRSSGDERNEDQRRIRRSESPIEKHNRWNNPDQDWSMGASSIDDYQKEHNKEDHPWTDSEKTRSKEPSKKQPQKEEGAGSWGLIGKERLRKDSKRTRSKGLPREEQLGENSKRMVSEDPPEGELQKECNKKARSRELAGNEQTQDDLTQEESREGNEKE